jgi:hypothetical protein
MSANKTAVARAHEAKAREEAAKLAMATVAVVGPIRQLQAGSNWRGKRRRHVT